MCDEIGREVGRVLFRLESFGDRGLDPAFVPLEVVLRLEAAGLAEVRRSRIAWGSRLAITAAGLRAAEGLREAERRFGEAVAVEGEAGEASDPVEAV
jgi:hypothetical protein